MLHNSLNVNRMNVGPGGKQAIMKDTVWNGKVQHLVDENGIAKGMKQVLTEREINTHGMNAAKMREELLKHEDFKNTKTLVQELVERRGHMCMFFPKFHCELNVAGVMLKNIQDSTRMDLLHACAKLSRSLLTHVILF